MSKFELYAGPTDGDPIVEADTLAELREEAPKGGIPDATIVNTERDDDSSGRGCTYWVVLILFGWIAAPFIVLIEFAKKYSGSSSSLSRDGGFWESTDGDRTFNDVYGD